ncbi:MAG TPA: MM0924 family protein [Pyrinomonadaceae bacterium]|jgi:putative aminopeptidase FrvX
MQEFLSKMIGRKVDIFCGGASSLRGEIVKVEGSVLHLKDDEQQMSYVAIEKIIVVWEARDRDDEKRAGFVPGSVNQR